MGLKTVCMYCRRYHGDINETEQVSHGICPECYLKSGWEEIKNETDIKAKQKLTTELRSDVKNWLEKDIKWLPDNGNKAVVTEFSKEANDFASQIIKEVEGEIVKEMRVNKK